MEDAVLGPSGWTCDPSRGPYKVYADVDPVTGRIRNLDASGTPILALQTAAMTPYRVATFGDSRSNVGGTHLTTTTTGGINGEKVVGQLMLRRGDIQICFNGGISGGLASDWNGAARISSSQSVTHLVASNPDFAYVQFGINDYIAGVSAATVVGYLQLAIDKIIGAGIPVVFESCNPCAAAAASYINGYASTGGFGASAASKLAEMQAGNAAMQSWLAQFPSNMAIYVDSSSVTTADDGYAKTDMTYADGTHLSRIGSKGVAALADAAITPWFPMKQGQAIKLAYPNGINRSFLSPSSGRANNFNTILNESGTATATYAINVDSSGDLVQDFIVTSTVLASGAFTSRFEIFPDWAGAGGFWTAAAGDVMQASFDYTIDNGAGGAQSIVYEVYGRQRIYYDDATNEYATTGSVAATASTDHPSMGVESGRILLPKLAVKAGKGSANMLTGAGKTSLQIYLVGNALGTFRLRVKNLQWAKVA